MQTIPYNKMPLKQQMQMLKEQCKVNGETIFPSFSLCFLCMNTEYLHNIDIIQIFFSLSNNNQINITYKTMKRAYIVSLPPYQILQSFLSVFFVFLGFDSKVIYYPLALEPGQIMNKIAPNVPVQKHNFIYNQNNVKMFIPKT